MEADSKVSQVAKQPQPLPSPPQGSTPTGHQWSWRPMEADPT